MKKVLCLILVLTLSACCLVAAHAEPVVGGWTLADDTTVPAEAASALEKAQEDNSAVKLEPVALLASQVVSGVNYTLLCKAIPASADEEVHFAIVGVWAKADGTAEIFRVENIGIGDSKIDMPLFKVNTLVRNDKGEITALRGRFFQIGSDADGTEAPFYLDGETEIALASGCTFALLNEDLNPEPTDSLYDWVVEHELFGNAPAATGDITDLGLTVELTFNESNEATHVQGFYTPWG